MRIERRSLVLSGLLAALALAALVTLAALGSGRQVVLQEGAGQMSPEEAVPAFTDDINFNEVPAEPTAEEPAAEEPAAEEEQAEDPHLTYSMLHPVYTRCAKKADMSGFSDLITRTCGDIHELDSCSEPCAAAMKEYSDKVGCCWETVMHAYKSLDPEAGTAWRKWQGTLSGKCGIVFGDEACGDSMGEHGYKALKGEVKELTQRAEQNEEFINDLYYQHYFAGGGGGYGDEGYGGDEGAEGDYYTDGGVWKDGADGSPPVDTLKTPGGAGNMLKGKRMLGSEMYDIPGAGDVHMPASAIKKARTVSLADAYDRSINYMNRLRLDASYKAIAKGNPHAAEHDEFFSWPGDSWTKKGGVMELAEEAPAEEGEEGGAPLASRAYVPLARGSFPLARGGLEGAVGNLATGEGVMGEAFVDPVNGRPLVRTSPYDERRYRLTEGAEQRQREHEVAAQRVGAGEEGTPMGWFDHSRAQQAGPDYDAGTWKLGRVGVRV